MPRKLYLQHGRPSHIKITSKFIEEEKIKTLSGKIPVEAESNAVEVDNLISLFVPTDYLYLKRLTARRYLCFLEYGTTVYNRSPLPAKPVLKS